MMDDPHVKNTAKEDCGRVDTAAHSVDQSLAILCNPKTGPHNLATWLPLPLKQPFEPQPQRPWLP